MSGFRKSINPSAKIPAVIFDVDGTLADCTERRKFWPDNKKEFFNPANVIMDKPFSHIVGLAQLLANYAHLRVLVVSARSESDRKITAEWLLENRVPYEHLYLRANNDPRQDEVVKREILREIQKTYEVIMVFDDRDRVVKMWREEGLPCLQVAEGSF